MKIYTESFTVYPKARYVVGATGVKQIARDCVSGLNVVLNMSKQQKSQTLISLIMEHGCGKQYI